MTVFVYRWHLDQLQKMVPIIQQFLTGLTQETATTYRDSGDGWTVAEVLGHLADFDEVFLQRAQMTVAHDPALFPFPDPDEQVAAGNYNGQPLHDICRLWAQRRHTLHGYLAGRSEGDWQATGNHPHRGTLSLADQLALVAWHDVNHLEQMSKIMAEQQPGA